MVQPRCLASVLLAFSRHRGKATRILPASAVVAAELETIYHLDCGCCHSSAAVERIYKVKGRKLTSPLAICVADVSDIPRFASVDGLPNSLLDSLLPGPVTVVLKRGDSSILEKTLNPGFDSIGVRVPDCNFIRSIARGSESALALTSANLSGQPSSVSPTDFEHLWHHCEYVFDGGLLKNGRAGSTLVDLTVPGSYKILRSGSALVETTAVLHSFGLDEAI
ncbi:hypothetical protein KSP40_PGU006185 [Platanthera guangdongensis]|uniref:Threonylcarbamoyl-AMP synthase n=1 Tax=Platanthera guangdongensis TaxID=2320717 RepID=A0ABR2MGZ4_9ASPA